jgi:hypothetical protein
MGFFTKISIDSNNKNIICFNDITYYQYIYQIWTINQKNKQSIKITNKINNNFIKNITNIKNNCIK